MRNVIGVTVLTVAMALASQPASAGSVRLFGQGCGGDLIDSTGALPVGLSLSTGANCSIGGGSTTGVSSESGIAGAGILGVSARVTHDGPGSAFQSGMQASFTQDITFVNPNSNDPINVALNLVISGLLTADPGTGYSVDLTSTLSSAIWRDTTRAVTAASAFLLSTASRIW